MWRCVTRQKGEDLGQHAVALEVFHVPGGARAEVGRVLDFVVDHFGVVGCELGVVVAEGEGFGAAGEGLLGFDEDKVVDFVPGGVEADFEVVEFGVDHHEVVDFASRGGGGAPEGLPAVGAAEVVEDWVGVVGGGPGGRGEGVERAIVAARGAEDKPDEGEDGDGARPAPEVSRSARHGELKCIHINGCCRYTIPIANFTSRHLEERKKKRKKKNTQSNQPNKVRILQIPRHQQTHSHPRPSVPTSHLPVQPLVAPLVPCYKARAVPATARELQT